MLTNSINNQKQSPYTKFKKFLKNRGFQKFERFNDSESTDGSCSRSFDSLNSFLPKRWYSLKFSSYNTVDQSSNWAILPVKKISNMSLRSYATHKFVT